MGWWKRWKQWLGADRKPAPAEEPVAPVEGEEPPDPGLILGAAASAGDRKTVLYLLDAGVAVDGPGKSGFRALHEAAHNGHLTTVDLLLARNAAVDARSDEGFTPLHMASLGGQAEAALRLLLAGAPVDARCSRGLAPLHLAAIAGDEEVVRVLLEAGADLDARDAAEGRTPLDVASKNPALAERLRERGARTGEQVREAVLRQERAPGFYRARLLPNDAEARPLLVFMDTPGLANLLLELSSLSCVYVTTLAEATDALTRHQLCGLVALSPPDESGTAAQAIRAFRKRFPAGLTVYHGWDYRLEVSGPRALACAADALIVGGADVNGMLRFLFTLLQRKADGSLPAPSVEGYEALLRECLPTSPFWKQAEQLRKLGRPEFPTA